jgi:hypothetical protein
LSPRLLLPWSLPVLLTEGVSFDAAELPATLPAPLR